MRDDVIRMIQCPLCGAADLKHLTFSQYSETEIGDAVLVLRDHGGLIFIHGVKSTEGRNGVL